MKFKKDSTNNAKKIRNRNNMVETVELILKLISWNKKEAAQKI